MPLTLSRLPWITLEGIGLIVLGGAAVILPMLAGLATALVFGWLLLISGAIGLYGAYQGREHGHMAWDIASSLVALAIGVLLLVYPVLGAAGLVWLLGVYLFLDGVSLVGLAFSHKRRGLTRWRWIMASGFVDLLLALVILVLNVTASAILLGVIVGVDLIFAGLAVLNAHGRTSPGPLGSSLRPWS